VIAEAGGSNKDALGELQEGEPKTSTGLHEQYEVIATVNTKVVGVSLILVHATMKDGSATNIQEGQTQKLFVQAATSCTYDSGHAITHMSGTWMKKDKVQKLMQAGRIRVAMCIARDYFGGGV
jgi:hypothetical protein